MFAKLVNLRRHFAGALGAAGISNTELENRCDDTYACISRYPVSL